MNATKSCNLSLLNKIAKAKEITYMELRREYFRSKSKKIVPDVAGFDYDLDRLASKDIYQ